MLQASKKNVEERGLKMKRELMDGMNPTKVIMRH
jgi:hypothetical protein